MAFTTEHLAAVETAIARGERKVRFRDREVEYRTVGELLEARDEIRAALAENKPRARAYRLYHAGRGL
ncbi:phage head-tail joining protein [Pseudomonas aeruginosa]|uniref:phage head-tail joining protein n=1 Tax=Pseudomonas aeruginosa TaxID=287 RepID=UPI0017E1AC59